MTDREKAIAELRIKAKELGKSKIDWEVVEAAWLDWNDFAYYAQLCNAAGAQRLIDDANQWNGAS